jgi:hypothetical protein
MTKTSHLWLFIFPHRIKSYIIWLNQSHWKLLIIVYLVAKDNITFNEDQRSGLLVLGSHLPKKRDRPSQLTMWTQKVLFHFSYTLNQFGYNVRLMIRIYGCFCKLYMHHCGVFLLMSMNYCCVWVFLQFVLQLDSWVQ